MPFTAKIKRDDPFCSADQREIYAIRRRIAGAALLACRLLPELGQSARHAAPDGPQRHRSGDAPCCSW